MFQVKKSFIVKTTILILIFFNLFLLNELKKKNISLEANNNNNNNTNNNSDNNNIDYNNNNISNISNNNNNIVNETINEETLYLDFKSKPLILNKKEKEIKDIVMSRECKYVDVVYTWVNGSDPKHQGAKKKARNDPKDIDYYPSQYRDFGTLKYSLRSVRQYAPWVRKIFIITANQIPDWFNIDNSDNVKFIFHEDYFHNKSHLPTFSSNAIESNFWNLPAEVSNCFLFLNDDVFFTRPVNQSTYFDENFNQVVLVSKDKLNPYYKNTKKLDGFTKSLLFTIRAVSSIWNETISKHTPAHGVHVFNRKIWYKIQEEFGSGLEIPSANKFRNFKDFQMTGLYVHYAMKYSNCTVSLTKDVLYVQLNNHQFDEKFEKVKTMKDNFNTVCLNDGLEFINDELIKKVDSFFNESFPTLSPYELETPKSKKVFLFVLVFILISIILKKSKKISIIIEHTKFNFKK
ncbi:hypothetical protein RB653_009841 [Dictyostelium firmibasis]|uniref:Glycosyltransferase n=1 Tax=Dictyostelium firmibasis TaxID=79012 RepID=A0AAN7TSU9_9MYCE